MGMFGAIARGARGAINLGRRALARARGPSGAPDLRQLVRGNFFGIAPGQWQRVVNADWLGPYTPQRVPFWILKLMRDDPQLSLGLTAYKSPFFGIGYDCEGSTPEIRAFVRKTILERPILWKTIASALNALDYGVQFHELLWKLEDVTIDEDGPGGVPEKLLPLAYVLEDVYDIDPEDIVEVIVDQKVRLKGLRLTSLIEQLESGIPAEKLLHAVNEQEHRSPWGRAVLKRSYNPFFWGGWLASFYLRFMEGRAEAPLVGRAPNEYRYDATLDRESQTPKHCMDELNAQIVALRQGGGCTLPDERDKDGEQRWEIEPLKDAGRPDQFLPALLYMDALKLRSICVPERVATQDGSVGTYASNDVHLNIFFSNLERVKRNLICQTVLTEGLFAPVVRANFGRAASVPRAIAPDFARDNREFFEQLVRDCMEIPRELEDGQEFNGRLLLDINKSLRSLNVPIHRPQDVAVKRGSLPRVGAKAPPASPGARAPTREAPIEVRDDAPDGDRLSLALRSEQAPLMKGLAEMQSVVGALVKTVDHLAGEVNAVAGRDTIVKNEVRVPAAKPAPAPIVEVNVPAQKAPVVNVSVPPAPAPIVHVDAPTPPPAKSVEFTRDKDGRITGAEVS